MMSLKANNLYNLEVFLKVGELLEEVFLNPPFQHVCCPFFLNLLPVIELYLEQILSIKNVNESSKCPSN